MNYIKRKSTIIMGTMVLACMGVNQARADKAEDATRQHDSEYITEDTVVIPQIRWNIIGSHTGVAHDSEKFIQPAKDCLLTKDKSADYLLQLELCKQERKGWLKI